jgi:hypothetical protein
VKCDCIERVDEKLKHAFGTRLATTIVFNKKMDADVTLSIETVRLEDSRAPRRKKPQPILVTFCPFCGTATAKVEREETK